jgi:hypothetical protein
LRIGDAWVSGFGMAGDVQVLSDCAAIVVSCELQGISVSGDRNNLCKYGSEFGFEVVWNANRKKARVLWRDGPLVVL